MLYLRFNLNHDWNDMHHCQVTKMEWDLNYEERWLESDMAKRIIKEVDKSDVVSAYSIKSPILGNISPSHISNGAKTLIMMYECEDTFFDSSRLGDNCFDCLLEIAKNKDIFVLVTSYINLSNVDKFIKSGIVYDYDTGEKIDSRKYYDEAYDELMGILEEVRRELRDDEDNSTSTEHFTLQAPEF